MGSLSKAEIKSIRALQRKKERKQSGHFIIEGEKLITEAMAAGVQLERLLVKADASALIDVEGAQAISAKEMEQITTFHTASPALAIVNISDSGWSKPVQSATRIIALDGISDPGNLGTILRSADWFGVQHVLMSDDCVDLFNPKTVQATMGSLFHLQWELGDLPKLLSEKQEEGFKVWVTHLKGDSVRKLSEATSPVILVIGSESHGVRPEVDACADHRWKIPGSGDAESLNAGIAAAIALYEWSR